MQAVSKVRAGNICRARIGIYQFNIIAKSLNIFEVGFNRTSINLAPWQWNPFTTMI